MNMHAVAGPVRQDRQSGRGRAANAAVVVAALLAIALAGGCSILKPDPDNSRYFVLSSTQGSTSAPSLQRPDIHFGLGPIQLPGYLDTQNIVRAGAGGSIEYVPSAFWAESVSDAFLRALLYRTAARLGTSHAVAFPWYSTTKVDWKVPVDVLQFEATSDGRAVLVARWSVESTTGGRAVAGKQSVFEEKTADDPAAIVEALNRCVDRLADAIAVAIANAPAPPQKSGTGTDFRGDSGRRSR